MATSSCRADGSTLADVTAGQPVEVIEVDAPEHGVLLAHGLRPGVRLVVDGDAPFGGPRIVQLGSRRIAIDRRLADTIRVRSADDAGRRR